MSSSPISSSTFPTLSTAENDYYTFLRQNTYELIDAQYDVNLSTPSIFSTTSCNSDCYQREAGVSFFSLETTKKNNGVIGSITDNNMSDDKQLVGISVETPKKKKK